MSAYRDWLILALLLLLVLTGLMVVALTTKSESVSRQQTVPRNISYEVYGSGIYTTEPPEPRYPPLAKSQASFYRTYTIGDMQYDLVWTDRNVNRNAAIGSHAFTLTVYNSRNSGVTITDEQFRAVSVGCIAKDNPYRAVALEPAPIARDFLPYEKKAVVFAIDVSCMYLGAANGEYFWRIY